MSVDYKAHDFTYVCVFQGCKHVTFWQNLRFESKIGHLCRSNEFCKFLEDGGCLGLFSLQPMSDSGRSGLYM